MSLRLKLTLLLICLFLTSVSNSIFVYQLEKISDEQVSWINRTHLILNISEKYLSALKDAETGKRGYIITEDRTYLEPYTSGIKDAEGFFLALTKLTSHNSELQEILKEIASLMALKFDELERTITLTQRGNKNKAIEIVVENKGKQYMDGLRDKMSVFNTKELILLEQRKNTYNIHKTRINTLIAVELVFFISLAIVTFFVLRQSLFTPLALLFVNAKKIESGEKLVVHDVIEKNEMGNLLSTFFDMSQKIYEREQTLNHLAHHDELTGLKNRLTVSTDIDKSISELQGNDVKLAVLFIDLDLFKEVNDTLGHDVGDLILKETADRLTLSVRSSDAVFRIGGDEFLVIVKNVREVKEIHAIVKKIVSTFSKPANIKGMNLDISISIGVSISPDDSTNGNELVKFSDIAMYASKRDKDASYKLFNKSMLKRESDIGALAKP